MRAASQTDALLASVAELRPFVVQERRLFIEQCTVPDPATLDPDMSTMTDPDDLAELAHLDAIIARADAAMGAAEWPPFMFDLYAAGDINPPLTGQQIADMQRAWLGSARQPERVRAWDFASFPQSSQPHPRCRCVTQTEIKDVRDYGLHKVLQRIGKEALASHPTNERKAVLAAAFDRAASRETALIIDFQKRIELARERERQNKWWRRMWRLCR